MPQAIHGLGGSGDGPAAALAGRPLRLFASSTPYGLYRQLLSAWVGVAPEEGEEALRSALAQAMKAMFGAEVDHFSFLST